jgi:hypothetical protein
MEVLLMDFFEVLLILTAPLLLFARDFLGSSFLPSRNPMLAVGVFPLSRISLLRLVLQFTQSASSKDRAAPLVIYSLSSSSC